MGHSDANMILKVYQHTLEDQGRKTVEMMPDVLELAACPKPRARSRTYGGRAMPHIPGITPRQFPSLFFWTRFG